MNAGILRFPLLVVAVLLFAVPVAIVSGATSNDLVPNQPYDPLYDPLYDVAPLYGRIDVADVMAVSARWNMSGTYTSTHWSLTGNGGTVPETNFLGTTDFEALELRVNDQRALRIEPAQTAGFPDGSPNIIAGHSGNATGEVVGATIAGGGYTDTPNEVLGNFGTVGGGRNNAVSGALATIGGGENNLAGADHSTISGGLSNVISDTALYATVLGGRENQVALPYSLAGGRRAQAQHQGSFVWADSTDADFVSTADDQFRLRASGGGELIANTSAPGFSVSNAGSGHGLSVTSNGEDVSLGVDNNGAGPAISARSAGNGVADLVLGGNSAEDDDGIMAITDQPSSDLLLFVNDDLEIHLDDNDDETYGAIRVYDGLDNLIWSVDESGGMSAMGNTSAAAAAMTIDHPQDPANRTLSHPFVASPDMLTIYSGNVALDERGEAWAELPGYFETLNRDYRYQLTAIGAAMPDLHVASKIRNNRFKIAGGKPLMEVSWQVSGIRQDSYAQNNPIVIELDKAQE